MADKEYKEESTKEAHKKLIDKENEDTKTPSSEEVDDAVDDDKTGVDVSEEYQQKAHHITHKASKPELTHLRGKMNDREDTMRKEEADARKKSEKDSGEFSDADMPASSY